MLIEILIAVIPIIIAIISLVYAIKQRNVVKKEISKKRYLESAQVNLNKAIQILKSAELPSLPADAYGFAEAEEKFEDEFFNANELVNNILRASFKLKKRKLTLSVSYKLIDMGEYDKPYSKRETREYTDFSQLSSKWMSELFQSNRSILLESDTSIPDFQPLWWNEISFNAFEWSLKKYSKPKTYF